MQYLFLILLITSSATMALEDLKKLTEGMLTALNVDESHEDLLRCLDSKPIAYWENVSSRLNKTVWDNFGSVFVNFREFTVTCSVTLNTMIRCCKVPEKIRRILNAMGYLMINPGRMAAKVRAHFPRLVGDFKEYLAEWGKKDYAEAGKVAGKIVGWFFLRP
eukprot:TRINITY_DN8166_c0_g1_i3.p1 TRINITY_DN8166_c0_g1~~TRINITY_DN8166_c0_g1_i3.p1  ORF type:complete len:162 (+),score=25.50 TRINITY_DN8166_c0_g1_i3:138-623(+)